MNLRQRPSMNCTVPVLALAAASAAVVAVTFTVSTLGVDGTLRLAGALALLACATLAAAIAALSMVLRRRLGELRHLPDLGRRYETHHDGVHLTAIATTTRGKVAVLASESAQTIVLDESGAPDQVRRDGPRDLQCPLSEADARKLQHATEAGAVVTVTTAGVYGLTGPVRTGWRIHTAPGPAVRGR